MSTTYPETPAADLILDRADFDTEEAWVDAWLAKRQEGLGSSDASAIWTDGVTDPETGERLYGDRWSVFQDKLGMAPPLEVKWGDPVDMGNRLEPVARQMLEEHLDEDIPVPGLYRNKTLSPLLQDTPDGITAKTRRLVEVKTTSAYLKELWKGEQLSIHALLQVHHGMATLGLDEAVVIALIGGRDPQVRYIESSEKVQERLVDMELAFWEKHIAKRVEPTATIASLDKITAMFSQADPKADAALLDDIELFKLRTKYEDARSRENSAKREKEDIGAEVKAHLKAATALAAKDDPSKVYFTWDQNGKVQEDYLRRNFPELVKKHTKTVEVLDLAAFEAAHPKEHAAARGRTLRTPKITR